MKNQDRPQQDSIAAEAQADDGRSGLANAIRSVLLFIGRPFRPLLLPFNLMGKGLTGLIGLTIYCWAFLVIALYAAVSSDGAWGSFRAAQQIEAISLVNGYHAIMLSWPSLLLGLVILLISFEMDDERGGVIDALLRRVLVALFMATWVLAALLFFVSVGYTIFFLPFAMANGRGLEMLLTGPFSAIAVASGLLLGLSRISK